MGFSRQEYWGGLPFPSPGNVPAQGSNSGLLLCRQILHLLSHQGSPSVYMYVLSLSLSVHTCAQSCTLKCSSLASVNLELVTIWEESKGFCVSFWSTQASKHLVGSDKPIKINSLYPLKKILFGFWLENTFRTILSYLLWAFLVDQLQSESACNAGDLGSITGLGRSPGEVKGYPLQYSGLENSMDCKVHGIAKSWTRLSDFQFSELLYIPGNYRQPSFPQIVVV